MNDVTGNRSISRCFHSKKKQKTKKKAAAGKPTNVPAERALVQASKRGPVYPGIRQIAVCSHKTQIVSCWGQAAATKRCRIKNVSTAKKAIKRWLHSNQQKPALPVDVVKEKKDWSKKKN